MSSSSKTLLFATVLTGGICAASLFRKPPGATDVAPTAAPMTHRLEGPRVVVGSAAGDLTLPAPGATANRAAPPRASIDADRASNEPPAFPQASSIGNFPLTAPPAWSRDAAGDGEGAFRDGVGRRSHRVEDGDTLATLAQRYLGDAARAGEIHAANRGALPASGALPIGIDVVIPPTTGVPRGSDRAVPAEAASTRNTFDPFPDNHELGTPADPSSPDRPAWMSEPAATPPNNPVAPGVIRPASETMR